MLEVSNLSFSYSEKGADLLKGISFTLERGASLAIMAPSGYGKTTLGKVLAGHLTPQKGEILCDGKSLSSIAHKAPYPIQLLLQSPEISMNPRWRVKKILLEGGPFDEEDLEDWQISPSLLSHFPHQLSGGELQRVALARLSLSFCKHLKAQSACNISYVVCDEISAMLDAATQYNLWKTILSKQQEYRWGLLIISHDHLLLKRLGCPVLNLI